jgi:hypothetical protein
MVLAVIPTWVAPAAQEVRDAHRIAQALGAADPTRYATQAAAATISWVTVGQPAPLTGRANDVTEALARGEMMLASAVSLNGTTEMDPAVWSALGVEPARSLTDSRAWASGVGAALAWMLGASEKAPVPLPLRGADGRPVDARTLYEERLQRHHWAEPEQRKAAWTRAQQDAARSVRLAELVESVAR